MVKALPHSYDGFLWSLSALPAFPVKTILKQPPTIINVIWIDKFELDNFF